MGLKHKHKSVIIIIITIRRLNNSFFFFFRRYYVKYTHTQTHTHNTYFYYNDVVIIVFFCFRFEYTYSLHSVLYILLYYNVCPFQVLIYIYIGLQYNKQCILLFRYFKPSYNDSFVRSDYSNLLSFSNKVLGCRFIIYN